MSLLHQLQSLGFTMVNIDMARGVSITAWRATERKTYQVYFAHTLEDAEAQMIAQVEAPATPQAPPASTGFEDLI